MRELARRRRPQRLACAALGAALGCAAGAGPGPLPEPSLGPPHNARALDAQLDAAIADAIPSVSYESHNPAIVDPLGREDVTVVLPRIETLDGEAHIVCLKNGELVFGACAFPPGEPAP